MCPPGTHWVSDCNSDGQQDKCEPCPEGSYTSKYNIAHLCAPCRTECTGQHHDRNIVQVSCTNISDLKCACKEGYWLKRHHQKSTCRHVSSCRPGSGVQRQADDNSDTTCATCQAGFTFSNITSTTELCRDCTVCGDAYEVVTKCTPFNDTVCQLKEQPYDIVEPIAGLSIETELSSSARITWSISKMTMVVCFALLQLQSF
ncbi:hypothetical protein DPMN_175410 [Dreissena polymorpha]|uniref:TNFR-Cys domain-containing protein n=1 Tax=Dreissena polymorpha TaxID=45954 RepID=A0A9D4E545_DREPO|nr:hypothetical protein DPMN_175410 [Dreissena polymorpha]